MNYRSKPDRELGWSFKANEEPSDAPSSVKLIRKSRRLISRKNVTTHILILFLLFPVISSLESANWVTSMPSLFIPLGFSFLLASAVAISSRGTIFLLLSGLLLIIASTFLISALSVDSSESMNSGYAERYVETLIRLWDWAKALATGGVSTDPLPFIFLLVLLVNLLTFTAVLAATRLKNPWLALIPGGFILLTNISYLPGQPVFAFVLYLFASILLIVWVYFLKSSARWELEGTRPPDFMSAEVMLSAVTIAISLVAFAWVLPLANNWRPLTSALGEVLSPAAEHAESWGRLFLGVGGKGSVGVHSFGRNFPIRSTYTLDTEILLEVNAVEVELLRGASYDLYTGQGWTVSQVALEEFDELGIAAAQFGTVESRNERRQPVKVTVNTRASFSSAKRLLTAGEPLASGRPSNILIGPGYSSIGLSPVKRLNIGENYQTVGAESSVSISSLQNSKWIFPELITAAYAQVPDHVDNNISNLAETITSGSSTPYEATRRVENYLRSNYSFSLSNTKINPRSDIVSVFLFETRQGHFDHFASAMVILLRAIEIPARITVGFVLDDSSFNPATKNFELSDKQAWAWPQVYFENLGWIDFNPTPSRDLIMRSDQSQDDKNLLASRRLGASNSFMYDDAELLDMFAEFEVESEIENAFQLEDRNGIAEFLLGIFFRILTLVFLIGLVTALIFRFWWLRQFRDYQGAIGTWRKLEFWLRVSGTYPYQKLTALETAEYLSFLNLSDTLIQEFAREYSRALYSGHDLHTGSEAQQKFVATYRLIRRALIVWRIKSSGRKILKFWRIDGTRVE